MRRSAALLAGLVVAALPAAARAAPACRAEASVEPARAVVGEQVLYRVRVHSEEGVTSVAWSHQPAFPHVRTEPLPGDPQPAGEASGRVREERRALFAERAGVHRLRAPGLTCERAGGASESVPVPVVTLEVEEPPGEGRPEGFSDQVGPLTLHLTVTPLELPLGGSVRVSLMARGSGNLWLLPPPFAPDAFGDAEVFAQSPDLGLERGRHAYLGVSFVYDVVPRSEGLLRVPGIAVPFFDPVERRYRTAAVEPVVVRVGPRAPAAPAADPAPGRAPEPPAAAPAPPGWRWRWLVTAAALAFLVGIVWRRRRRAPAARAVQVALAEASESETRGDRHATAAALARALRAALAAHVGDAAVATPEEIAARGDLPPAVAAAAVALAGLERARFDPAAAPPDPAAVRRVIAEL